MDFARYLPLSQRRAEDETKVTGDRRAEIAAVVREAHRLILSTPPDEQDARARTFAANAGLVLPEPPAHLAEALLELAGSIEAGERRKIADLERAVRALLLLSDAVGESCHVAPLTLGAVAMYASTTAPFDRRAAISGHAVVAVDGDWRLGQGPELQGTAEGIVRFLIGLSDIPPRPPVR
ncbi:hypothetical protein [Microbacterium sp. E-13]|uniref:hypothetical protein n=1 Tax=Microbacterium sp. E-13 TaxID=3404048 RepID=UPI003CF6EC2D